MITLHLGKLISLLTEIQLIVRVKIRVDHVKVWRKSSEVSQGFLLYKK